MQDGKIDKQGMTDAQIATAMKNQLADIAEGKKTFIEANVEPKLPPNTCQLSIFK